MTCRCRAALALVVAADVAATTATSEASLLGDFRSFLVQTRARIDTITPALSHLGARSIEFPITSTTPGLVYDYDAQQGGFVPSRESLGPPFVERAETVGAGRTSLAFTYQYGDFDRFDAHDFVMNSAVSAGGNGGGNTVRTSADISIPIHEFAVSATYGVTDRWDVDVFLPLRYARLGANLAQSTQSFGEGGPPGRVTPLPGSSFDDGDFGVADMLLRTKYRLGEVDDFGIALGLVLGLPTGDPDGFRGTGDWRVEPVVIVSRDFGCANVHLNVGMDFDASSFDLTQARYALGIALEPFERLAVMLDVLGSSDLRSDRFKADLGVPPFNGVASSSFMIGGVAQDGTVVGFYDIPRFDMVSMALGLEYALFDRGAFYVSATVPLTNQGLHATIIPGGGITYRFD